MNTLRYNVNHSLTAGVIGEMEKVEMVEGGMEELVSGYNEIYTDLNNLHLRTKKFSRDGETSRCEGDVDSLRERLDQLESRVKEGARCELQRENFDQRIGWRLSHLRGKMAVVESLLECNSANVETSIGIEVEALSRWLEEVEILLPPVQWRLATTWSGLRRRARLDRLKSLGEEIERRGRGVSLMVTECQEARTNHIKDRIEVVDELVEEATLLEGRWQAAWLTCLEWQCLLEQLGKGEEYCQKEDDEEMEEEDVFEEKEAFLYNLECDDQKSESDSLDEAYSSLSLSDILTARDLSTISPVKRRGEKVEEEQGEGDNGSDSGVSELSQETTPEPEDLHLRVRGVKKERLRGKRRKETAQHIEIQNSEKKQGGVGSFWLVAGVLGVAVIFWLANNHIVCCDTVCAIALTPLLKYTNGPPPL